MNIKNQSVIQAIASNWWFSLLRGVLLVILGLYALVNPGLSLLAWAFVVGFFLISDGVLAIVAGIAGWVESRGWIVLRGVLTVLVGTLALWQPAMFGVGTGLAIIFLIAGWSVLGGILEIIVAIRERKEIRGEGWMILSGLFSTLFGIVLALAPLLSLDLFIRMAGAFAMIFGFVAMFASIKLRRLRQPAP